MPCGNVYSMPAPWGGIEIHALDTEITRIRPVLNPVQVPSSAPEEICFYMQALEEVLSVPQATDELVRDKLFRTRTFSQLPDFTQQILRIVSAIEPGQWLTYAEAAERFGNPSAARALGQALAHNPFPILIGCHRICSAADRACFDILKPESFRPAAYLGEPALAPVAQWLRLLDFSL